MTLKERYDFVLKNIVRQPMGTFPIYEPDKFPDFFYDDEKVKEVTKNQTFGLELTDKATDKEYVEYIKYVLEYTGMDEMFDTSVLKEDFDPDDDSDYE